MYFLGILGNNGIILHIYTCIITVFKIIIIIIIKRIRCWLLIIICTC